NVDLSLKYCLYADDSNIFFSGKTVQEIIPKVENFLHNFSTWCESNSLILNSQKTNIVIFRAKNKAINFYPNIQYRNETIKIVKEVKFLGVWIDEELNWQRPATHHGT